MSIHWDKWPSPDDFSPIYVGSFWTIPASLPEPAPVKPTQQKTPWQGIASILSRDHHIENSTDKSWKWRKNK